MKIVGGIVIAVAGIIVGTVIERKYLIADRVVEEYKKAKSKVDKATEERDKWSPSFKIGARNKSCTYFFLSPQTLIFEMDFINLFKKKYN